MNFRFILWTLVCIYLFSAFSCTNTKKAVNENRIDHDYNNSAYAMQVQTITIEGMGLSRDYNTAQFKALTNAREVLIDTMSAMINNIAVHRGFDSAMPEDFYLSAFRHVTYFDDSIHDNNGELLHRSFCTAKVLLSPMLQSLYQEKHWVPEYGYYQFLRDIDIILMTH